MISTDFCRMSECGNTPLEYEYFAFKEETQNIVDSITNEIIAMESSIDTMLEDTNASTKKTSIVETIGKKIHAIADMFMSLIKKIRETLSKLSFEHKSEAQKIEQFVKKYPHQAENMDTLWKTGKIDVDTCKTFAELDKAFTEAIHKPTADDMLNFWKEHTQDITKINEEFEKSPEKKVSCVYIMREYNNKIVQADKFTIDSNKAIDSAKKELDTMIAKLDPKDPADVARARQMLNIYKELTNNANDLAQLDQKMLNSLRAKVQGFSKKIDSMTSKPNP